LINPLRMGMANSGEPMKTILISTGSIVAQTLSLHQMNIPYRLLNFLENGVK
jgi:hypothetical protein